MPLMIMERVQHLVYKDLAEHSGIAASVSKALLQSLEITCVKDEVRYSALYVGTRRLHRPQC